MITEALPVNFGVKKWVFVWVSRWRWVLQNNDFSMRDRHALLTGTHQCPCSFDDIADVINVIIMRAHCRGTLGNLTLIRVSPLFHCYCSCDVCTSLCTCLVHFWVDRPPSSIGPSRTSDRCSDAPIGTSGADVYYGSSERSRGSSTSVSSASAWERLLWGCPAAGGSALSRAVKPNRRHRCYCWGYDCWNHTWIFFCHPDCWCCWCCWYCYCSCCFCIGR